MRLALVLGACGGSPRHVPSTPLPEPEPAVVAAPASPTDWTVVSEATGDLDGDGAPDLATISSREVAGELEATLRVRLSTGPTIEAPRAVCARCGGLKGGPVPFEVTLDAERRVLSLAYFGGSRELRWRTTKWRWQHERFECIGTIDQEHDSMADPGGVQSVRREANLSTGQMTEQVDRLTADAEDTVSETVECGVPAGPLLELTTYVHEDAVPPRCTDVAVE